MEISFAKHATLTTRQSIRPNENSHRVNYEWRSCGRAVIWPCKRWPVKSGRNQRKRHQKELEQTKCSGKWQRMEPSIGSVIALLGEVTP